MSSEPTYDELVAENLVLRAQLAALSDKVATLERLLNRDSQNSSKPPSTDTATKRRKAASNRQPVGAGRRPGKQRGSDGKHLGRVADPDFVIDHVPLCCSGCGNDLDASADAGSVDRQVFDIPAPKAVVTEHRAIRRRCGCGTVTTGAFPDGVTAPATYGPRVRAVALYLMARQHIPFERTAEAIADMFGLSVSTGWLDSVYNQAADGLEPFLTAVADQLKNALVIGVDETSDRVGLDSWWFHVARTDQLTLLHADRTRGRAGVEATGVISDYTGTLVHDRLGLYWNYTGASHGLCNAHLLRNLASVSEVFTQSWANDMATLLRDAKKLADTARTKGRCSLSRRQLADLDQRYSVIVDEAIQATPEPASGRKRNSLEREAHNLAVAFRDHRKPILLFCRDLRVPFDNNGAERDLRMVKLHQKISGSFRSGRGAERLAAVRSYISTGNKHHHNILDLLTTLTTGHPWIPPPLTT